MSAKELYFYNFSGQIHNEMLDKFTQETGIKVIYSTYESNDTLYDRLANNSTGYDLIAPSSHVVAQMRKNAMLAQIDKSKLAYFNGIEKQFLNRQVDPSNNYSVPYCWGAAGIGINSDMLDSKTLTEWQDLWDSKWEGQLMMLDDARQVFAVALAKLGYSPNSTNPEEIKAAYHELKKLMPNVLLFNSD